MDDLLPLFNRLADLRTLALLGAAVIAVALLRGDRRGAIVAAGALLLLAPTGALISNVLDRPAPYPVEGSGSFPSGHATAAAALVLCAALLARPGRERLVVGCVGCTLMLAAGLSVVADGGHWPGGRHRRLAARARRSHRSLRARRARRRLARRSGRRRLSGRVGGDRSRATQPGHDRAARRAHLADVGRPRDRSRKRPPRVFTNTMQITTPPAV